MHDFNSWKFSKHYHGFNSLIEVFNFIMILFKFNYQKSVFDFSILRFFSSKLCGFPTFLCRLGYHYTSTHGVIPLHIATSIVNKSNILSDFSSANIQKQSCKFFICVKLQAYIDITLTLFSWFLLLCIHRHINWLLYSCDFLNLLELLD